MGSFGHPMYSFTANRRPWGRPSDDRQTTAVGCINEVRASPMSEVYMSPCRVQYQTDSRFAFSFSFAWYRAVRRPSEKSVLQTSLNYGKCQSALAASHDSWTLHS